jgi:DNA-directed RNA polymerase specialized sigma24 family protein
MQPPTEPSSEERRRALRGDEEALYRAHHAELRRVVARAVHAPRELIEDACQTAWMMLLRSQPNRYATFGWLRVVAIHEAYRLATIERRDARLDRLRLDDGDWHDLIADRHSLDDALDAFEALRALADLPTSQREDLALKIAGHSYQEIQSMTGDRTFTNVNKSLVKARARIRRARSSGTRTSR